MPTAVRCVRTGTVFPKATHPPRRATLFSLRIRPRYAFGLRRGTTGCSSRTVRCTTLRGATRTPRRRALPPKCPALADFCPAELFHVDFSVPLPPKCLTVRHLPLRRRLTTKKEKRQPRRREPIPFQPMKV